MSRSTNQGEAGANHRDTNTIRIPGVGNGTASPEERHSLNRQILALAIPAFGALIAEPLFLLADSALIGQLGTAHLAGMSIAATLIGTVVGLMNFLAYSVTPSVARHYGAGNYAGAYKNGVDGAWVALGLGILLMCAGYALADPLLVGLGATNETIAYARDYLHHSLWGLPPMMVILSQVGTLRGLQDTVTPLKVAGVGAVVNFGLNWVLIYPVGWGVAGSATGTSITQWLMMFALGLVLQRGMKTHGASWRPDWMGARSVLSLGSWLMLRTLSMRAAMLLTVVIVARFGTQSLAAYQLGMSIFSLFLYALDSLAIAAQALLGKEMGARDLSLASERAAVRALLHRLVRMSLLYGAITALLCAPLGYWGAWIFTADAQVQSLLAASCLIIALGQPLAAYVFVLDGILMGAQDMRYLALGTFVMLLSYMPVLGAIWWAQAVGSLDSFWAYCALWVTYIFWYQGVRAVIFGRRVHSDVWMKA